MSFLQKDNALWALLSGVAADEGAELYDAELLTPGNLRVALAAKDSQPGPGRKNVSSGDCSRVCRRLMIVFQAEGKKYGLTPEPEIDVSSPGVNRNLRLPEHFQGAVGERVKVVLQPEHEAQGAEGRKLSTLVGQLEKFEGSTLTVCDEATSERFELPVDSVKRAQVDFKF
ncbi:MAG: hypothetical protein U0136_01045 [Bdellovibrionota bacterium]